MQGFLEGPPDPLRVLRGAMLQELANADDSVLFVLGELRLAPVGLRFALDQVPLALAERVLGGCEGGEALRELLLARVLLRDRIGRGGGVSGANGSANSNPRCARRPEPNSWFSSIASQLAGPDGIVLPQKGGSIGPSNSTSWRRSRPNCSRARRRASVMSAIASSDRAPSAFSMKLACLGEICAPPMR